MKNGTGIGFLDNGDIYSGVWKDGKRDGVGCCKFLNAQGAGNIGVGGKLIAYYKGQWVNDEILGEGIMVMVDGLTVGGKFKERG